ncbi:fatty acid--CoA ligase family protein [Priestia taiwanensis]|uniref:Long-chain-fatty-acid--CoA ligase n=1 Tax=Priestia taiwanensis TaxID=1347902 RepID=A0A917EQD8_9BACI|nr:fatty acid--CoA ligase family protein [Priestia taiwanensis]MBM7364232.1 long-chain acyl-CoA synthetase [Priestia taiwanensis]GGE72728.1 long-chain-fatty-acid--CoA ligase [Priestia taiwanensis]
MNVVHQFSAVAKQYPDRPAYIFMDQETTYSQLEENINRFADSLVKLGIKKGDHIALILGNTPHFVIGMHGALRIGATVIPVNPLYTSDEIRYILENGDVKAIITLDIFQPQMQQLIQLLPLIEHVILCETQPQQSPIQHEKMKSFMQLIMTGENIVHDVELDEEDVAVILYTSGTTGKPKGAMLTHKNIFSNARDVGTYLQYSQDDKVIAALPMFHVFCLTVSLNAPILCGATVIIMPKFSPAEVFRVTNKYKATVFAGVPTMYNFLFQYSGGQVEHLQSLHLCISGGASMPVALLHSFEKKFGVAVSEGFGLSEASPVTCFNPLDRPRKPGSIGTSVLNVENKVVDELGEEVPVGEVGELIVRGPNVMKGYYKMPEDTNQALRDGWLYTGDLAKQDEEGYFYIVDRKKDMVLVGGYNVYPREVEEVLYNHEEIVEAAVIGQPDENYGEIVKCFIVVKDKSLNEADIIAYCKQHLAVYKVPSKIEFLEELPKNTTGKILRRALRQAVTS